MLKSTSYVALVATLVLSCSLVEAQSQSLTYGFDLRGADNMVVFPVDDPASLFILDAAPTYATFAMDFDPTGTTLHVIDRLGATIQLGTVDQNTGAFTAGAPLGGDYNLAQTETGLSFDSTDGTCYLTGTDGTTSTLYTLDINTGLATIVGNFIDENATALGLVIDVAVNSAGDMYVHDIGTDTLYSVDKTSAMATTIGSHGLAANFAQGMDFDPVTDVLYAAIYTGGGTGSYCTWDTTTGAITEILDLPSFPEEPGYELEIAILGVETKGGCVAPASYTVFRGNELSGALSDFGTSDDVAARYNPGFTINNLEAPVWLVFDAVAGSTTDFSIESQAGTPGLTYTAEAWNWNTNSYDELGTQAEQFNADQTVTFAITPADHVDGSGNVRGRVGWRKTGFTINFPWEVRVDVFNFCN